VSLRVLAFGADKALAAYIGLSRDPEVAPFRDEAPKGPLRPTPFLQIRLVVGHPDGQILAICFGLTTVADWCS